MFQDILPHVFHNEYKPQRPKKNSYGMVFADGKLAVKVVNGQMTFPTFGELEKKHPWIYEINTYLFEIDEIQFYMLEGIALDDYEFWGRRDFRGKDPQYLSFAAVVAHQLYGWYKSNKYCGKCGSIMRHDDKERMVQCTSCKQMVYPRINPAIIVGVTCGNQILMSKYKGRTYKKYALLAGFIEIGETVEEAIKREVYEEVGLHVKNFTYYKSQPWPFSDSLLLGFYAEVEGDERITKIDEDELALAEWFERELIPVDDPEISLTNEMILNFKYRGYGN